MYDTSWRSQITSAAVACAREITRRVVGGSNVELAHHHDADGARVYGMAQAEEPWAGL